MNRIRTISTVVALALLTLALAAPGARAAYINGFVWNRSADWAPGAHQTSTPNPTADAEGNAVWAYGRSGPEDMESSTWYQNFNPEGNWNNNIEEFWDADGNYAGYTATANHHIYQSQQQLWPGSGRVPGFIPIVEWRNPLSASAEVQIVGDIVISHNKDVGGSRTVLAFYDASADTWTEIANQVVRRLFGSGPVTIPVDATYTVYPGDKFVLSSTYHDGSFQNTTLTDDSGLDIVLIPEPASLALLALGGLFLARRR